MRARPKHATIVAYLALFVALGGSAYAVSTGSIGTRELRDNDVRGKDIRARTIRASDVNQRSLAYAKPYLATRSVDNGNAVNAVAAVVVQCRRNGDVAVSGGPSDGGEGGRFGRLVRSTPVKAPVRGGVLLPRGATPNGWYVEYTRRPENGPPTGKAAAYAVCLPVGRR